MCASGQFADAKIAESGFALIVSFTAGVDLKTQRALRRNPFSRSSRMLKIRYLCVVDPYLDPGRFSPAGDLEVVPGPFLEVLDTVRTAMDEILGQGQ